MKRRAFIGLLAGLTATSTLFGAGIKLPKREDKAVVDSLDGIFHDNFLGVPIKFDGPRDPLWVKRFQNATVYWNPKISGDKAAWITLPNGKIL